MATAALSRPVRLSPGFPLLWAGWLVLAALCAAHCTSPTLAIPLAGGAVLLAVDFRGRFGAPRYGAWMAVALPAVFALEGHCLALVNRLTPVTYDALLARLDCGVAPAVRAWALGLPPVMCLLLVAYIALPLVMFLGVAAAHGARRRRMVLSLCLGAVLCIPCYLLFPAVGPAHVGDPAAPRNCMPSMHLTWALLVWMHSTGRPKFLAAGFVFLTALATLATGEHYLPDLLAALPWAWTMHQLGRRISDRCAA